MYQLVRGLADKESMERVLQSAAQVEGGELSLHRVTKLCEALEMGKQSQQLVNSTAGSLNRISTYQQQKSGARQAKSSGDKSGSKGTQRDKGGDKSGSKGGSCANCGSKNHSSHLQERREKCNAFHEVCDSCGTVGHYKAFCKGGKKPAGAKNKEKGAKGGGQVGEVSGADQQKDEGDLNTLHGSWFFLKEADKQAEVLSMSTVPNLRWDGRWWTPARVRPHARREVKLEVSASAYEYLGVPVPRGDRATTTVSSLVDTGAQMCVADVSVADRLGISREQLVSPALRIFVANNAGLSIVGAGFLSLSVGGRCTQQMVYFASGVGQLFLSQEACMELGVICQEFPAPVSAASRPLTGSSESRNLMVPSYSSGNCQSIAGPVTYHILPHVPQPMGASKLRGASQNDGWSQPAHSLVGVTVGEQEHQGSFAAAAPDDDLHGLKEPVHPGAVDNNFQVHQQELRHLAQQGLSTMGLTRQASRTRCNLGLRVYVPGSL